MIAPASPQPPAQPPEDAAIAAHPGAIPAATLVIFRKAPGGLAGNAAPQLLMVRRSAKMRFAAGAAVFPGGKVDPADRILARSLLPADAEPEHIDDTAARIAAIRETLEETGLVLAIAPITPDRPITAASAAAARALLATTGALAPVLEDMGWALRLDLLVPFARWCPRSGRAFDTRFYLADIGTGAVDIEVDATENTLAYWTSASGALAAADAGTAPLILPTRRNLERLAQFASFAETAAHARQTPIRPICAERVMREGVAWLEIPEGLGYPVLGEIEANARRG
ncbi:MAG TPA: NUDIX domain-containing protein [Novosphingobium sp.]|nr:NUDIX domain-containing protein [Novosphingobium sp.]